MSVWRVRAVMARSVATKQSRPSPRIQLWIASLRSQLIPAQRRLDEAAIMRWADQELVDADSRRHACDEGDGAAEVFGLQHPRLFFLARHHRAQLQDGSSHLARHQAAGAQAVDAFVHVE